MDNEQAPNFTCSDCGHADAWHLYSDGPHKRPCNRPDCKCLELTHDHAHA